MHSVMSYLASKLASVYIEEKAEGREYSHDYINKVRQRFTKSLESNIIGNHIRYASFLFCNGEYDEACKYFDFIEHLKYEDIESNLVYQLYVSPSDSLAMQIAKKPHEQTFKQSSSVFWIFGPEAAMCVPAFLRCEMYQGRVGTFTTNNVVLYSMYDFIRVQIQPYLYYLQYITYRVLHQEHKQYEALLKFLIFTEINKSTRFLSSKNDGVCGFFDTSLNMLGHCLELEQKLESAWETYTTSLQMQPGHNAAILHITRLLSQVFQSVRA
ncbi:hypothetical protein DPMN_047350 [Dreissena polymorpha]|uniref:Uncharacterized protein n=1 Tax=Dreissena polymorpha TaxID=45954 RepID=A0A9D4D7K4_DREPO|nr:hypothetical protein DPMN_047350 [Dreissena polymorpha]